MNMSMKLLEEAFSADDILPDAYARFDKELDEVAKSADMPSFNDPEKIFQVCVMGLRLRKLLNPEDNDLALGLAAYAITKRVLELRAAKRGERQVVE
jgi:hypothetical protein